MKSAEQYTNWTDEMYRYLSWCLFKNVFGTTEWYENEDKKIKILTEESKYKLTETERRLVENRALRLSNDYQAWSLEKFDQMYGNGIVYDDEDEGHFWRAPVEFDNEIYEIWKNAVRQRQTVKITYDSISSGVSERLVDPYKSSAPYGEGYCHNRQEKRKFRFDRVIDIQMTDKKFIKPKVL